MHASIRNPLFFPILLIAVGVILELSYGSVGSDLSRTVMDKAEEIDRRRYRDSDDRKSEVEALVRQGIHEGMGVFSWSAARGLGLFSMFFGGCWLVATLLTNLGVHRVTHPAPMDLGMGTDYHPIGYSSPPPPPPPSYPPVSPPEGT